MGTNEQEIREIATQFGQEHVFRFWDELNAEGKRQLLDDLSQVDFALMKRLVDTWIRNAPEAEKF